MTDETSRRDSLVQVRLWDPFLRIFHWALVFFVVASWLLGQFGPGIMTLHFWSGYAIIGLLAFRLIWGVFGAWPARFWHFIYGPGAFLRYLRGIATRKPSHWPGHNPVGALSVFLLLGVLGFQAFTGLYTDPEDFINAGPLVAGADSSMVGWATGWHQRLAPVILALVLLHFGAIVFYKLWKHENLVAAMLHGRKVVRGEVPSERVIATVAEKAE